MSDTLKHLHQAQRTAVALFDAIEQRGLLEPGITETEASRRIHELAGEAFDGPRWWHRRVVRAGANTVHPYNQHPPDVTIQEDDIVFVDLGPVFDGWEADFGRTWVLGDDPRKIALRDAVNLLYEEGRAFAAQDPELTGARMHAFMTRRARELGYVYGNVYSGHLVGEFPHDKVPGEKVHSYLIDGNDRPLHGHLEDGTPLTWILESHLVDEEIGRGGFVEGLLHDPA